MRNNLIQLKKSKEMLHVREDDGKYNLNNSTSRIRAQVITCHFIISMLLLLLLLLLNTSWWVILC